MDNNKYKESIKKYLENGGLYIYEDNVHCKLARNCVDCELYVGHCKAKNIENIKDFLKK